MFLNIKELEIQPPYGELLSSSCGGMQHLAASDGPLDPKVILLDGQTEKRTTGVWELDILFKIEQMKI